MKDLIKKFFGIFILSICLITTVFATTSNGALTGRFTTIAGQKEITYLLEDVNSFSVDKEENIFLVDNKNNKIVVLDKDGSAKCEYTDFKKLNISKIEKLTFDNDDNMFIVDTKNANVIKLDKNFNVIGKISKDIKLGNVIDIAVAKDGYIYIADFLNNRIVKLNSDLSLNMEYLNIEDETKFKINKPTKIVVNNNEIYIIDNLNTRIVKLDSQLNYISNFSSDLENEIYNFVGITFDKENNIYVADKNSSRVIMLDNNLDFKKMYMKDTNNLATLEEISYMTMDINYNSYILNKKAGNITKYGKDMKVKNIFKSVLFDEKNKLLNPISTAYSASENIYVVDKNKNRVVKINKDGTVIKEKIGLVNISAITIDEKENIYIVVNGQNKIFKLNSNLEEIKQKDIPSIEKEMCKEISGIAVDDKGNIYLTASNNILMLNSEFVFQKSFKTQNESSKDIFKNINGITIAKNGTIYVVDSTNNNVVKLNKNMSINHIYNSSSFNGESLNCPSDIAIDEFNNIYIADTNNNRIVKFDENMKWITSYDKYVNENLLLNNLNKPTGITTSQRGIFVTDSLNNVVSFMPYATVDNPINKEK